MSQHYPLTAIALAVAGLCSSIACAASADSDVVVVTASRFADRQPRIPANVSVITREDIASSPSATVPDLLGRLAGVHVRTLYGAMATDATVDMRGFGDSAASNTLILLDGLRLNPIDSSGIEWSSIPLESVARIEVLRGSGTVLYGDRASGGVINIITDKSARPVATVAATAGSFGYKAVDAHAAGGANDSYYNLTGHYVDSDGWRRNSQADQQSVAGRVGHVHQQGEAFIDFSGYKDSSGTPGAVFRNQFINQPDMARFPLNYQFQDGYRVRPGFTWNLSSSLTLDGELGYAAKHSHSRTFSALGAPSYRNDRDGESLSATPRLRWKHGLGGLQSDTVFGFDYYDGRLTGNTWSSFSGANMQRVSQKSNAAYVQNVTGLGNAVDLTVGARNQRVVQEAEDRSAGMKNSATRSRNAWDIGLAGNVSDSVRLFGKAGRTFRFPNTDELFGFDPLSWATIFAGDLKPQQGTIREVGASWTGQHASVRTSVFRTDLTDEIAYDANTGSNVNLVATRHQGVEIEADWRFLRDWRARLALTVAQATFTEGANAGKDVPSVPHDKASLEVVWQGGPAGTWSVLGNYVGRQRYSGDTSNIREVMGSYATVDLKASWDLKPWVLTARIANLLDRKYASTAGYSTTYSDYFYYPADPRSAFLTLGYKFR